jgi:hypothetical protein
LSKNVEDNKSLREKDKEHDEMLRDIKTHEELMKEFTEISEKYNPDD